MGPHDVGGPKCPCGRGSGTHLLASGKLALNWKNFLFIMVWEKNCPGKRTNKMIGESEYHGLYEKKRTYNCGIPYANCIQLSQQTIMILLTSAFLHKFNFEQTNIVANLFLVLPGNVGVSFDTICCHGDRIRSWVWRQHRRKLRRLSLRFVAT